MSGPWTFTATFSPCSAAITASTVPSPPSATGTLEHSHSPNTSRAALLSNSAVFPLVRLPLKESDANKSCIWFSPYIFI